MTADKSEGRTFRKDPGLLPHRECFEYRVSGVLDWISMADGELSACGASMVLSGNTE